MISFEITAEEWDVLVKYHQDAIQAAIERADNEAEVYHETRLTDFYRHAEQRSRRRFT